MIVQSLTAKQSTAVSLSTEHAITVYEGAVRSSKTITSLLDWIKLVRNAPPGKLLVSGKTERTLRENIIGPLIDMLGPRRCRYVQGSGTLHLLGRQAMVIGANDERSAEKIRGVTIVGAYVDELTILPESFWTMLLSRLSVDGARVIATTNPGGPAHWLKKDYLDRARTHLTRDGRVTRDDRYDPEDPEGPIDLARLTFLLSDNPTLPVSYVRRVQSLYTGLWRRRYILGEWVAAEGAVFDMLDLDGKHRATWDTVRPLLSGRYWLGIDYGTSNATHAVLLALGQDQRMYVVSEWRHDGRKQQSLSDYDQSQALRAWLENGAGIPGVGGMATVDVWPDRTAVDPSAASLRRQLRNDAWTGLVEADNAVIDGIRNVGSLLAAGRLLFVEGAAPELERELLGYVWDPKAQERGEDAPLKVADHGVDGLRYGVQVSRQVWRPWLQHGLTLAA